MKFVKIQSPSLSKFHGRPIYLRAGIILPRDFEREPNRKYPLWVRIGGWGARYSGVNSLMGKDSEFRKTWLDDKTPHRMNICLQLDRRRTARRSVLRSIRPTTARTAMPSRAN